MARTATHNVFSQLRGRSKPAQNGHCANALNVETSAAGRAVVTATLDPTEYDHCGCGAIRKDIDAGRFGSSLGDDAIEIYHHDPDSTAIHCR